jgi:O-antigen ligase
MRPPLPPSAARWRDDVPFLVFLATVPLCLLRAKDLPSVEVGPLDVTIADVFLAATALLALVRLRERRRLPAPWLLGAAFAFGALLVVTALPNGSDALTAAGKIAELGALTLGAALFLDSSQRVRAFLGVVVVFATVAAAWAFLGFLTSDRGRQAGFMGEHDMAALATLAAAVGLARLHARRGRSPGWVAIAGLTAGLVGAVLAASLASLIGIYLTCLVVLVLSARRRDLRLGSALVTVALATVATAGTLALRQGELGFLQEWFGTPSDNPGANAASWSHRLVYTYIGGRIFLDHPLLGTGWHGLLPPEEFARYVPDARRRFPDQPSNYFPPTDEGYIPQQTYDQVLFELGLVGAALFVVLAGLAIWRAAVAARRRPGEHAYLPSAWLAALAGALAGAALFGGSPLTAMLWLTLGFVAAESDLPEAV